MWVDNHALRLLEALDDAEACAELARTHGGSLPALQVPGRALAALRRRKDPCHLLAANMAVAPETDGLLLGAPPPLEDMLLAMARRPTPRRGRPVRDPDGMPIGSSSASGGTGVYAERSYPGVAAQDRSARMILWGLHAGDGIGRGLWRSRGRRWELGPGVFPLGPARRVPLADGPGVLAGCLFKGIEDHCRAEGARGPHGAQAAVLWTWWFLPLLCPSRPLSSERRAAAAAPAEPDWLSSWALYALHPTLRVGVVIVHAVVGQLAVGNDAFVDRVCGGEDPLRWLRKRIRFSVRDARTRSPLAGEAVATRITALASEPSLEHLIAAWEAHFGGTGRRSRFCADLATLASKAISTHRVALDRQLDLAFVRWTERRFTSELARAARPRPRR